MIAGLSGSLLSHDALTSHLTGRGSSDPHAEAARARLLAWHGAVVRELGPSASARTVFDRVAVPLARELGFHVCPAAGGTSEMMRGVLQLGRRAVAALLVVGWGRDPAAAWRDSVRLGIGSGVRWCLCVNGCVLRVLDARRTYSRRFVQFDIDLTLADPAAFTTFWRLLQAAAFASASGHALDEAVAASEAYRHAVRESLQHGVREALTALVQAFAGARRRRATPTQALFDDSLVVIYRVLFLLFAEARGLVPGWHPTYRESYTIEALRDPVERQSRPAGLWESLQAIARLAHRGCRAGSLEVTPFNGRLFSPAHAPLAETLRLDDTRVRDALLALTTRREEGGRRRISYADLGVEQLGGVYEGVLDFEPQWRGASSIVLVEAGRRKAAGAFYTPRSLTEYLVRRTLAPLVADAPPGRILCLRVLDPSMGSGAFLVAACRYLAAAYESALVRDGEVIPEEVGDAERARFRRLIAQRCLFGVDINPMAVQLGRLSLWLATLSASRPLTFLDHHLRTGNSLAGASLADVARQAPGARPGSRPGRLPLFDDGIAEGAIGAAAGIRLGIAGDPGDTIEQVREKERLLAGLAQRDAPLERWKAAADLWCAEWFRGTARAASRQRRAMFGALVDELLGGAAVVPPRLSTPWLEEARAIASRERFFHWTLEFPEVFHDADGRPLAGAGFDAVIGNPPWEVLRGPRPGEAQQSAALLAFARTSGLYALQGEGHANLFQLFLERSLALVRAGGRFGLLVPAGLASDHGCASLRRHLLDRTSVDTWVSIENHDSLFPVHRSIKFLLLGGTAGGATPALPCRAGVRDPAALERLPDVGLDPGAVGVSRALITRLSGEQAAIPELRGPEDVRIVSRIAFSIPTLGDPSGWHVAFGRELNASEDRRYFVGPSGAPAPNNRRGSRLHPIVEGKQVRPFFADVAAVRFAIPGAVAATLLDPGRTYERPRLAYRDVASPSNRLTLIAAVVPAGAITTHTLFCLKGELDLPVHHFLCGVFNSFVANYLVRLRVNTHVTAAMVGCLPVPLANPGSAAFEGVRVLAERLARFPDDGAAAASLQARVAWLYGLTADELAHILDTFPLVPVADREAALAAYPEASAAPSLPPG